MLQYNLDKVTVLVRTEGCSHLSTTYSTVHKSLVVLLLYSIDSWCCENGLRSCWDSLNRERSSVVNSTCSIVALSNCMTFILQSINWISKHLTSIVLRYYISIYIYNLLVIFSCFVRAKSARNSREIRAKFVKSQREIPEGMIKAHDHMVVACK